MRLLNLIIVLKYENEIETMNDFIMRNDIDKNEKNKKKEIWIITRHKSNRLFSRVCYVMNKEILECATMFRVKTSQKIICTHPQQ